MQILRNTINTFKSTINVVIRETVLCIDFVKKNTIEETLSVYYYAVLLLLLLFHYCPDFNHDEGFESDGLLQPYYNPIIPC